ncbi:hypothetical protein Ccrd_011931 [Cynara cardunculus var. scolymus]|uniref:Uncharacterized protein n=1 Tax=Cynara cardunculus var. scolymus TaxID=59895 RepID=A0A103YIH3_CYNCS|nr:hypothetical protein Ccrd_011931 [Cynara cardunculus var. scolymus]
MRLCVFYRGKEVGMMGEGYMWIITGKTTNFLDSLDVETIALMQGAVGSKSYFPASRELHDFELNWRKEYFSLNPFKEFKELDPNGIWAYDAVCALAMGVERIFDLFWHQCSYSHLLHIPTKLIVLGSAGERLQSNLSRFVVTVSVFVVFVLTSSYIVTLTSLLAVQQIASKEGCIGFQDFPPIAEGAVFNSLEFAEWDVDDVGSFGVHSLSCS